MSGERVEATSEDTALARVVTKPLLIFFILGDILGGGIYALVGEVGGETGGAIWAAFLLALVLAALTAASYAELVTKYPRAGGAALYAKKAFGHPLIAFVIAFAVMASGIASASTLARAFGGDYLAEFIDISVPVAAITFICIVAVINLIGILLSVRLNVVLTIVELSGLVLVVLIGAVALGDGVGEPSRAVEFKEGIAPVMAILGGAAVAFYALIGFEDSVNISEETKEPRRNLSDRTVCRPRCRRIDLHGGDGDRLDGRPDPDAGRIRRGAARGRPAWAARDVDQGLLGDRPARLGERRPDQHDHGLAPALRDGRGRRRPPCLLPPQPLAHPRRRHPLHHRDLDRADPHRRPRRPRRHHRPAAPLRLHHRQYRGAGAAPRSGRRRTTSKSPRSSRCSGSVPASE